jgi:hypothetical protein
VQQPRSLATHRAIGLTVTLYTLCSALAVLSLRSDHISVHARSGTSPGGRLHGNHDYKPGGGNGFFHYRNGKLLNGLVAVGFELEDTHCNGGAETLLCRRFLIEPPDHLPRQDRDKHEI